jgi:DNA-binding transcriptional regulator YhcF (GntR family)
MLFKENQPIYLQIADLACERILLGQWAANERIPSVRELGVEIQVNPNTVLRSYELLEQRQIITNRRGVGYSVAADAANIIRAMRREQFIAEELPLFFKNLHLLNISIDEVKAGYETFQFSLINPHKPSST